MWLNNLSNGKTFLLILAVGLVTIAVAVGVNIVLNNDAPAPEKNDNETISDLDYIIIQMAGFWRMDYSNPVNAQIMVLSEDGGWKSPGPLTTDSTIGGSFVIADIDSESGFYNLLLTVEYSDSEYTEIGLEMDGYVYDAENDKLGLWTGSEEGFRITWFIRELTPGDSIDRAALNDHFHKEFFTVTEDGRLLFHERSSFS